MTTVSKNWHLKLFERNRHLWIKFSRLFAVALVRQEDADIYIKFFERYSMLCNKWTIKSKNVYNIDESWCCIGLHQKSQVIVSAGEADAVTIFATDGNRKWATLVETIQAPGTDDIPAFIIYKGASILDDYIKLVYNSDTALWCTENGWTNNKIGVKWLKHFIKYAEPAENNGYWLLLLDGHCHATLIFKNLANDYWIILLYLSSHMTHQLQPLDVEMFGLLAQYYSQLVKDYVWYWFDVSKWEWTTWMLEVWKKTNSLSKIQSIFQKFRLISFDLDIVLRDLKHPKK